MNNDTNEMNYGSDYKYIPVTSLRSGEGIEVLPDVYMHTIQIVGNPDNSEFVLIDAGMPKSDLAHMADRAQSF